MIDQQEPDNNQDWLIAKSQVQERPFTSETAVISSLIVRFREFWNSISTKWYIRPLLQQQNEFNQLVVSLIHQQDEWLIAQDREQTNLTRDLAELTVQLTQANRLLQSIDDRLAYLEQQR